MKAIWKFNLKIEDIQTIETNVYIEKILCVKVQDGIPCIWTIIDNKKESNTVRLLMIGTGHSFDEYDPQIYEYIDSLMLKNDRFVSHIFLIKNE